MPISLSGQFRFPCDIRVGHKEYAVEQPVEHADDPLRISGPYPRPAERASQGRRLTSASRTSGTRPRPCPGASKRFPAVRVSPGGEGHSRPGAGLGHAIPMPRALRSAVRRPGADPVWTDQSGQRTGSPAVRLGVHPRGRRKARKIDKRWVDKCGWLGGTESDAHRRGRARLQAFHLYRMAVQQPADKRQQRPKPGPCATGGETKAAGTVENSSSGF